MLLIVLITVPLISHYYLSNIAADDGGGDSHRSRSKLDHPEDLNNIKISDLKFRIEELKRIKASVNNELRDLESKRQKLHTEISGYNTHLDKLKSDYEKSHVELQQLRATIENTKLEQEEMIQRNMPELTAPKRILPSLADSVMLVPPKSPQACRMNSCFDYSRCSVTSKFPVYLYEPGDNLVTPFQLDQFLKYSVTHAVNTSPHMTYDALIACIYIVLIGEPSPGGDTMNELEQYLHSLPYWHGDGRNHIIVNLARTAASHDMFDGVNTGRAIVAQSSFYESQYRMGFDILLPPSMSISHGDVWDQLPFISPARRKHMLSFLGEYQLSANVLLQNIHAAPKQQQSQPNWGNYNQQNMPSNGQNMPSQGGVLQNGAKQKWNNNNNNGGEFANMQQPKGQNLFKFESHGQYDKGQGQYIRSQGQGQMTQDLNGPNKFGRSLKSAISWVPQHQAYTDTMELVSMEQTVVDTLKRMQSLYQDGVFNYQFVCPPDGRRIVGVNAEWAMCGLDSQRHQLLKDSTFSLIIAPTNVSIISTTLTQIRLYEALKLGAIPVILGDYLQLPFHQLLEWEKAVIILPKSRVTELHFYIQSMSDMDILRLRQHGRLFWEKYLGSTKSIIDTMLALLRTRLHIPPFPIKEEPSPSVFNASFVPLTEDIIDLPPEAEEMLGPMEGPLPSPKFRRNYTVDMEVFNGRWDPFHLYPYTPFEPIMPAEAKFLGK